MLNCQTSLDLSGIFINRLWSFPFKSISHMEMFLFIVPHTTNRIKNTHMVSIEQTIQLRCYKHVSKWWSSEMELYNYLVLFKENRKLKDIHIKVTSVYHQRPFFIQFFINVNFFKSLNKTFYRVTKDNIVQLGKITIVPVKKKN